MIQTAQPEDSSQQLLVPALSSERQHLFGFDGQLQAKHADKYHETRNGGSVSLAVDSAGGAGE